MEPVARMVENRRAQFILVGKPQRKRPLERRKYGGEDRIKRDFKETCWEAASRFFGLRVGTSSGL